MPDETKPYDYPPVDGYDVYHWPEFQAFAKRLGLQWELPTVDITIEIPLDGRTVYITHGYQGKDTIKTEARDTVGTEHTTKESKANWARLVTQT